MSITITTPGGGKVRSASHRRFIVVVIEVDRALQAETGAPFVRSRSDSLETARKAASKAFYAGTGSPTFSKGLVFDTAERRFV